MTTTREPFGWAHAHATAFAITTGRSPSKFEVATAAALHRADAQLVAPSRVRRFRAVSAATGAGKSLGAVALLATKATGAIIIKEIAEAHQVYLNLVEIVGPDRVAILTSIHRDKASAADVAEFEQKTGFTVGRRFTEADFRNADLVVCCHKRWKGEIESGRDRGVRLCRGQQRDLIVVDEDPGLEQVHAARPADVAALAHVLGSKVMGSEARAYGFGEAHPALSALLNVEERMQRIVHDPSSPALCGAGLIEDEEVEAILAVQYKDIRGRLQDGDLAGRTATAEALEVTLRFLQACCEGRVFFHKSGGGIFHAYSFAIPPQPNTIILDGTADMNGLYAIGQTVETVDGVPVPDYRRVQITYITPPKDVSAYFRGKDLSIRRKMVDTAAYFREVILANTEPGEEVLVYAKKGYLDTDLQKEADESGSDDPYYCEWQGRKVRWCHFGSGRGTNRYKDCTVYFQFDAFHKPKGVVVAEMASHRGIKLSEEELQRLSPGGTTDADYRLVKDSLIATDTKQNAARICIRKLDDQGVAQAARLYFVGTSPRVLQRYLAEMFPGAALGGLSASLSESLSGPERLAAYLQSAEGDLVTSKELVEVTGVAGQHLRKYLSHPQVVSEITRGGWKESTRKEQGLPGKGWVLVRGRNTQGLKEQG